VRSKKTHNNVHEKVTELVLIQNINIK
jgi:hypothetical protein